jgi:TM2 domain-containing membrane protein YozV
MSLAKWASYLLAAIGIFGGVNKILEGEAMVGFQLIVFCLVVAGGWLAFIHYILRTSKEDNYKIK